MEEAVFLYWVRRHEREPGLQERGSMLVKSTLVWGQGLRLG